ncbi:MAG: hypothetical protein C0608_00480 [Deltaproteobacteria bacterium]|nr:MAG: hypothetical protein C0608_00480 [Deltaproteobacteria bacterium]
MASIYLAALFIGLAMGALFTGVLLGRLAAGRTELERRLRDLSVLHEASSTLSASFDLTEVLDSILDIMRRNFGFQHMGVRLLNERGQLEVRAAIGLDTDYAEATKLVPTRYTMFGRAFLDAKPVVVRDTTKMPHSPYFEMLSMALPVKAMVHVPMIHEGKPIGVLMFYSTRGPEKFGEQFVSLLQALANQMALSVVNARLYSQVHNASVVMEERVRQRTAELEAANKRLLELDRVKSEFLSNVSHELRTPLTSIKSFSEIFLRYDVDDRDKRRKFAEIIHDEADRLTRMINDLLDYSKIEAGKLDVELVPVPLEEVVEKATQATRALFDKNSVKLVVNVERSLPPALADFDRLMQVMTNLLGNASKFSPFGSKVLIRARRRGGFAVISVTDEGPGIDQSKLREIFDRFKQLRDPQKHQSLGTGLGLSICRDIVERLGGYIWVESPPGKGATFTFTVPLAG